jgi:hypothetical protein
MIAEGVRMKIALVFLFLLAMTVLALPFSSSGDSSMTGAVQSYMSYSLSLTGVLLGMLTIFMSRSLSDELVNRQIFLVMTKPVPRWQYILGKFTGISLLNLAFLIFSGLCIFAMVHYIKATREPLDEYDKSDLSNSVLVARHGSMPILPDFKAQAEAEYQRNLEEGIYATGPQLKPDVERARLAKKYEAMWRILGPYDIREFYYEDILCDRSAGNEIQLRYKTNITKYPPDEVYRAWFSFGDPLKGAKVYDVPVRHVIDRIHTVRVPADAVAPDQTLKVTFYNQNPYPGEPKYRNIIDFRRGDGPEILFVVGSFGGNFIRLLSLMMFKLMFLAALAILATTVLSFPVACLVSFTIYALAGARSFIAESIDFLDRADEGIFDSIKGFFIESLKMVFDVAQWIVPDFGRYDAVESFVNGRNVSLVWVLQGLGDLAVLKTVMVLGLAMLLFHRREVAEISL